VAAVMKPASSWFQSSIASSPQSQPVLVRPSSDRPSPFVNSQ
jgi:hypothetical protein